VKYQEYNTHKEREFSNNHRRRKSLHPTWKRRKNKHNTERKM